MHDAPAATHAPGDRGLPTSAIAGLVAFGAYALLCPPASGMGDSSEFALVLAAGGVAHPTGYPLYTLGGHAFVAALHTLGVAYPFGAALWSAVGGGLAIGLLHALASLLVAPDATPGRAWRALATTVPIAVFALQPVVVIDATRAEVNAWSLAWGAGAAYAFVRIVRGIAAGRADDGRWRTRAAVAWGVVCGAGAAHHLTSVWVSLALTAAIVAALVRHRRFAARLAVVAVAAGLVPLAGDAWVAWRAWHPAAYQWHALEPSWTSVWQHLSAHAYRVFLGRFRPDAWERDLLRAHVYPFLAAGFPLLAVAALRARGADERIARWGLFAAAALATLFVFLYGVNDPSPYFLTPMGILVAAAAAGLATIPGLPSRAGTVALAAAAIIALWPIAYGVNDARAEFDATMAFERTIHSMWTAVPPDTAIVSWTDDRFNRLIEYQRFRGENTAATIITPDMLYVPAVRRDFIRRFGVDPAADTQFPAAAMGTTDEQAILARSRRELVDHLNAHTRVPVIIFDPAVPIVFRLRKPWEPEAPTSPSR